MQRKRLFLTLCTALALATTLVIFPATSRADLTIMPLRVLFNDRDRSADMTLANRTGVTNTYRIEWVYNRVDENGRYKKSDTPIHPGLDFTTNLVFSPRQVTIGPQSRQNIRLSLRRPADLPEGEYRAHLALRKLAAPSKPTKGPEKGIGAKMSVNVGFSVPVIVRVGAYDAQVTISDIKLLPPARPGEGAGITLVLNRTGKHSTAGKVQVFWTPPGGKEEQIGILNNVNVFTEINRRIVGIALTNTTPITGGTLRVVYEGSDSERGIKLAEATLPIQ